MWNGFYFILFISLQQAQSGSVCSSNNWKPGRRVTLSGYNNDTGPCECQITLHKPTDTSDPLNTNISITHFPVSCNDSIYWLDGNTTKVESKHENSTFNMVLFGILYVRMENKKKMGSGELCFNLIVTTTSPDFSVAATCQKQNKNTKTTTVTTSIPTSTTSTTTTSLPKTSDVSQTVDSISNNTDDDDDDGGDNSLLPIILGCIIGILVIILVIIITCISLRKRNCQKNRDSENLNHGSTNMAVYSSLDDNLNDSSQYGHIVRQQEHVPEQQKQVPDLTNEYANIPKKTLEGPNDNRIESNNNPNTLKIDQDYKNLKERKP